MAGRTILFVFVVAIHAHCALAHGGHHATPTPAPAANGTVAEVPVVWAKYGWDVVTVVHGFCMIAAFLVLFPLGAICAARKSKTHTYIQCAGVVVAAFGFIVMFLSHGFFEHFSSLHSHLGLLTLLALCLQVVYGFIAKFKMPWSVGLTEAARREAEIGSDIPFRVCCIQVVNFPRVHSYLALALLALGFATTFWGYFTALDMCGADHTEWGLWSNCRGHFFVLGIAYAMGVCYMLVSSGLAKSKELVFFVENLILFLVGILFLLVVAVTDDHDNKELCFLILIAGCVGMALHFSGKAAQRVDTVGITLVLMGFFFFGRKEPTEFGEKMRFVSAVVMILLGVLKVFTKFERYGSVWGVSMFLAGTVFAGSGEEMCKRAHAVYDHSYLRFVVWLCTLGLMAYGWWFFLINFVAKYKVVPGDTDHEHHNGIAMEERVKFAKIPNGHDTFDLDLED